jgi:hypothetical protein
LLVHNDVLSLARIHDQKSKGFACTATFKYYDCIQHPLEWDSMSAFERKYHIFEDLKLGAGGFGSAYEGTVRVFRQKFTLDDATGSHACSLEAKVRVTNGIPLGSSLSYQLTL